MKVQFGQQVAGGDAQESAGGERERTPQQRRRLARHDLNPQVEQHDSRRHHQGVERVDHQAGLTRAPAGRHQRGDGQRIERLVQDHRQERGQARQPDGMPRGPLGLDCGCQGDSVHGTVHGQPQRGAPPGKPVARPRRRARARRMTVRRASGMCRRLAVRLVQVGRLHLVVRREVMMEMEESLQEEHHHESTQDPVGGCLEVGQGQGGVRQHVQQSHAQHDPRHEADRQLHPGMRERQQAGDRAPHPGGEKDQQAVDHQYQRGHASALSLPAARQTRRVLRRPGGVDVVHHRPTGTIRRRPQGVLSARGKFLTVAGPSGTCAARRQGLFTGRGEARFSNPRADRKGGGHHVRLPGPTGAKAVRAERECATGFRDSGRARLPPSRKPAARAGSAEASLSQDRATRVNSSRKALHDNYLPVLWISRGALARGLSRMNRGLAPGG